MKMWRNLYSDNETDMHPDNRSGCHNINQYSYEYMQLN